MYKLLMAPTQSPFRLVILSPTVATCYTTGALILVDTVTSVSVKPQVCRPIVPSPAMALRVLESAEDWEPYLDEIRQRYLDDGQTMKAIQEYLKSRHHIQAT